MRKQSMEVTKWECGNDDDNGGEGAARGREQPGTEGGASLDAVVVRQW